MEIAIWCSIPYSSGDDETKQAENPGQHDRSSTMLLDKGILVAGENLSRNARNVITEVGMAPQSTMKLLINFSSTGYIELLIRKSNIPGLCKDITDWICEASTCVTCQLSRVVSKILGIHRHHNIHRSLEKKPRLLAIYLGCQILTTRLLAAVSLERVHLEIETQILTNMLFSMGSNEPSARPEAEMLLLVHLMYIAHATRATTKEWGIVIELERKRGLVERGKFERWCKLFGRKVGIIYQESRDAFVAIQIRGLP